MSTVQTKQTNLREKLAELLDFRKMRDRLSGLGLYIGKDRTGTDENLLVRGGANVDDLQIGEIAALVGGTAVDVFVYDTSRDSDGGAWRKRTSHTSWYNEELNTATRGARREFPAVAVIVAESGNVKKLKIYDGDNPDLPLWMSFEASGLGSALGRTSTAIGGISSVYMLNGLLCVTGLGSSNNTETLCQISFIDDVFWQWHKYGVGDAGISERNQAHSISSQEYRGRTDAPINVSSYYDVAMTILPNAPIDENTGLPVPTIAVATDGGVSVIKDDGGVVDLNVLSRPYSSVYFSGNMVWAVENPETDYDLLRYFEIPTSDITTAFSYGPNSSPALFPENTKGNIFDSFNYGSPIGITKLDHEGSMVAYTTSKYNTGWMPGDIKLATLSDTTVETIGVNSDNLLTGDNSTFDSGEGDWDGIHAILSVDANRLKVTSSTSTDSGLAYLDVDTVVGARYSLEVSIDIGTSPEVSLRVYNGAGFTDQNTFVNKNTSGTYYLQFNAESSTSRIVFANNSVTNGIYSFFDDVSLKQTTELITNGDFSNGTTGWNQNDADSFTVNSLDQVVITSNTGSTWQTVYQGISTVIGKKYTASVDVVGNTNLVDLWVGTSGDGSFSERGNLGPLDGNINGTGRFSATFIATTTTTFINLAVYNGIGTFDNISVRPAVEDRSVNNNGLQIVGEIDKTPVAPGADLVAYSGFSANNYLVQPYNADLDFGTGDFCVMGWFKRNSNSTYHRIWNRADSIDHHRVEFYTGETGNEVYFYTRDDSAYTVVEGTLPLGIWTHLVGIREGGTLKIYENGVLANSTTGVARDLTSENNAVLQIGAASSFDSGVTFEGSIALFRISATAPSTEQIAKIYRDEKALFQDGAQATLYGSSDAVTALAYDEKTELLHVGTSSGRSDFSGLRRINNTTTAITTSISAHNNLIAEQ